VNYLPFALAALLLAIGLRRAFAQPTVYRGKISGPILTAFGAAVLGVQKLPPSIDGPAFCH
jgi:hypothetical protein